MGAPMYATWKTLPRLQRVPSLLGFDRPPTPAPPGEHIIRAGAGMRAKEYGPRWDAEATVRMR